MRWGSETAEEHTLRAAIVGCGRISTIHIETLRSLPGVEIVGLCDQNLTEARKRAFQAGTDRIFTDLETMAKEVRPDVIHLLTPPRSHPDLAEMAVAHGAHLYIEKPLASSEEEARRMLEASARAGTLLCPGHNRLFDPIFLKARKLIRNGEIGRVLSVRAEQGFRYEAAAHSITIPWSYTYDWGIYENLMPHPLYLASHFLEDPGEPKVVGFTVGRIPEVAVEEIHAVIPSRAAVAEVVLSMNGSPEKNQVEIVGTEGRIIVDFSSMRLILYRRGKLPDALARFTSGFTTSGQLVVSTFRSALGILTGRIKRYPGVRNLIREFYRCIAEGKSPPVRPEEGLLNVRQMEQIRRSCEGTSTPTVSAGVGEKSRPSLLVTGATGFVGRRLVERLNSEGGMVRATTRLLSRGKVQPGVQWVRCDLLDFDALRHALTGIDTVFHCAALVGAPGTLEEYEEINVKATMRLARLAGEAGVRRMIYLSSIGVYRRPAGFRPFLDEDAPYEDRPKARGAYTQTKLAAERALIDFSRMNKTPQIVILRPGTIYGPGAPVPVGRLRLPSPAAGRPFAVGGRRVPMPLTYLDNVIDAMISAAHAEEALGRTYNLVDSANLDQGALARALRQVSENRIKPLFVPYPLVWIMMLGSDLLTLIRSRKLGTARFRLSRTMAAMRFHCSAARKDLGWEPRVPLAEGLRRVLAAREEKPYPH